MVIFSLGSILIPLTGLAMLLAASNFGTLPHSQYELIAYFIAAVYIIVITEMWQS